VAEPADARTKRNVLVLASCQALLNTTGSIYIAVAALVGAALADNPAFATLPVALGVVGTAAATLPASLLMKRVGRRAGFIAGAGVGVVGACGAAYAIFAESFALFCGAALVIGSYRAFGNLYRFAAADVAPEHFKSRAISYVLAGGVVAGFIGPSIAKLTRDAVASHEFVGCLLAMASLAAVTAVLVSFVRIPRVADTAVADEERPLRAIARQPQLIAAVLAGAIGYAVMALLMTATPLAMIGHHHSFDSSATVIQWHVVAMFLPSFVTGSLINRFGTVRILLAGTGLLAGACITGALGTSFAHFIFGLVLLGVGWNFLFIGGSSLLTRVHTAAERAKTQGLNDFIVFGSVAVAALSSGQLLHHFSWTAINLGALPVVVAAAVTIVVFTRGDA
jgi:MFS family permease